MIDSTLHGDILCLFDSTSRRFSCMVAYAFVPHWWHTLYEMNGCIHCIQSTSSILAIILEMIGPDWPKSPVKFINSTPYYIMKLALFRCIMYVFSKGTNYCCFEQFFFFCLEDITPNSRNSSWNMYFTFVLWIIFNLLKSQLVKLIEVAVSHQRHADNTLRIS